MKSDLSFLLKGFTRFPIGVFQSSMLSIGRLGGGADIQLPGRLRALHALILRETSADNAEWNYRILSLRDSPCKINGNSIHITAVLNDQDRFQIGDSGEFLFSTDKASARSVRLIPDLSTNLFTVNSNQNRLDSIVFWDTFFSVSDTSISLIESQNCPAMITFIKSKLIESRRPVCYIKSGIPPFQLEVSKQQFGRRDFRLLKTPDDFALTSKGFEEIASLVKNPEYHDQQDIVPDNLVGRSYSTNVSLVPLTEEYSNEWHNQ